MTPQAASATYTLITYSNAYTSISSREAVDDHAPVRFKDVVRDISERLLRKLMVRRMQAQRNASLRRAAREAAAVEAYARGCEESSPAMAQELRAAAAFHIGKFD